MTDEELLALYGSIKEMSAAMKTREAALAAKTAALDSTIAELKSLPLMLGKQTSQYIAAGVKQSIQDDFSRPIAEAVKGPIAEFTQATYYGRDVMRQVGEDVRFRSRTWLTFFLLIGFGLGETTGYLFSKHDRMSDPQKQISPSSAPASDAKPGDGKKKHRALSKVAGQADVH